MNFEFSEEQVQLRDSLLRYMQKAYGFEQRREIIRSSPGWSREHWKQFAEMGLTAIGLPEDHGGLGGDAFDTYVVMETFGRGLVIEPYLATVVLGAGLIARAGTGAQKSELLPKVASGELQLALAHQEAAGRYELAHVATKATANRNGYTLDGVKTVVLNGADAGGIIVSARTSGGARDAQGVSLFLIDAKAAGVSLHGYPTQDGQRAAELTLKNVQVGADALVGKLNEGLPLVEHAVERAIAALCAEAVGAMGALLEITGAYLKTRKQFGIAIGTFQVLQHRMADMLMAVENAKSMAYLAAAKLDSSDAAVRRRTISAAKALIGQAGRHVGQQAVQLHGGIGVTDELNVSHYFKRLTMIDLSFGDAAHHLARYSDLMLAA